MISDLVSDLPTRIPWDLIRRHLELRFSLSPNNIKPAVHRISSWASTRSYALYSLPRHTFSMSMRQAHTSLCQWTMRLLICSEMSCKPTVLCGGQDQKAQFELMAREQNKETRYQRRGCALSDFLVPVTLSAQFLKWEQKCTVAILEEVSAVIYLKNKARPCKWG